MGIDFRRFLAELYEDEDGAHLVEYVTLVFLVGIATLVGMTFLGQVNNNKMNNLGTLVGT
jgi:Flp pilus assembly pilin Flp